MLTLNQYFYLELILMPRLFSDGVMDEAIREYAEPQTSTYLEYL